MKFNGRERFKWKIAANKKHVKNKIKVFTSIMMTACFVPLCPVLCYPSFRRLLCYLALRWIALTHVYSRGERT